MHAPRLSCGPIHNRAKRGTERKHAQFSGDGWVNGMDKCTWKRERALARKTGRAMGGVSNQLYCSDPFIRSRKRSVLRAWRINQLRFAFFPRRGVRAVGAIHEKKDQDKSAGTPKSKKDGGGGTERHPARKSTVCKRRARAVSTAAHGEAVRFPRVDARVTHA